MIGFWALLFILTRIEAAWLSPLRPLTPLERALPAWPPTSPLPLWLERVLIAPWARWDAHWYARIATAGYRAGDGTTQFYPLYPLLAIPLIRLGLPPMAALTLISLAAGLGAVILLERLARREMDPVRARQTTLAFVLFPTGFLLFAPYTEALFLLLAIGSLGAARGRRWGLAGLLAALAALTRPQGIFLLLPLAWLLRRTGGGFRNGGFLLLPPLALGGWSLVRIAGIDGLPATGHGFNAYLYALLFSPHANQVVTVQAFLWPWEAMGRAIGKLLRQPDVDLIVNLILAAWFLILMIRAWRWMDRGEQLYTLAVALSAFSYHTGPVHPYMGLPRHLWIAFPVFLALGRTHSRRLSALPALQAPGFFFVIIPYILEAWVP